MQSLRNIDNLLKFGEVSPTTTSSNYIKKEAETWGGLFWEIRKLLGKIIADKLLFSTWISLQPSHAIGDFTINFANNLLNTAQSSLNRAQVVKIQSAFDHRNLYYREEIKTAKRLEGKLISREATVALLIPDFDETGLRNTINN